MPYPLTLDLSRLLEKLWNQPGGLPQASLLILPDFVVVRQVLEFAETLMAMLLDCASVPIAARV